MSVADAPVTSPDPYSTAVRAFIKGVDVLNALPFGGSRIGDRNVAAARDAGYTRQDGYTREQLEQLGAGLRGTFEGYQNRQGPQAMRLGTMVSPVDVLPPLVTTFPQAAIGAIIAAVLGTPREAGRGSDLCVPIPGGFVCDGQWIPNTARPLPRPSTGPRRRGRRGRAAGRPRRARAPANPVVRPSSGPVTVSRPRVTARPATATVAFPMPQSLPKAPPIPSPTVTVPKAPSIPKGATTSPVVTAARQIAQIAAPYLVPQLLRAIQPGRSARPGRVTVPGASPFPLPAPAPAAAPLTAFNAAVAQSPAQDLDRQCRERAKQKRKPKKKRTVCYRGTYTETASGLFKRRKEKIKCRASSRKKPRLRRVR